MGLNGQRRAAQKYLEKPTRIFYTAGGIAAVGLILGFYRGEWKAALIVVGIGALYALLYFPWKSKHDKVYGKKSSEKPHDSQYEYDEWS